MSDVAILCYFLLGFPVGVGIASSLDDLDLPDDTRDAASIIAGLLWPLVFAVLTAFGVYLGASRFVALWRHVRGSQIPRAVARDRSHPMICNCPACKRGLYCADGSRGEFERSAVNHDSDPCRVCERPAREHRRTQCNA